MTLDDFRRLNFREVGTWPWLPKIIMLMLVVLFIVGLGAFFDWKDQWESLGAAEQEEVKLKEQYTQKKAKAINYDLYVQQLAEVEQSFGALVKQLPNRSEIDALLTDINQAGLGRGLQFDLFRPAPQEKMADFYAELPIKIKLTGSYHQMGEFVSGIAALPRIVTLHEITIKPENKDMYDNLSFELTAKTFRYLDDAEVAAAEKAKTPPSPGT